MPPGAAALVAPPGIMEFNVEMRMKYETAGVIAPAAELGLTVDPVLEQLAGTLGAGLLQYRPAVALGHGGTLRKPRLVTTTRILSC